VELQFLPESVVQYAGDAVIVGVRKGAALDGPAAEINTILDGMIERLIASGESEAVSPR
jgi:hypothetical protein